MALESVIAFATALLGGLIAAGATLVALFWRMGRATANDGSGDELRSVDSTFDPFSEQRIDDLRDYVDGKFDVIDQRFKTMQDQLDRRFDAAEGRLDTVEDQVGNLEARVDELHEK